MGNVSASRAGGTLALLALGAVLAGRPVDAGADGVFSAEAAVLHDSNLPRAVSQSDIVGDTALNVSLTAGQVFAPGDRDAFTLSGDLRASQFDRFHGMNSFALGGTGAWARKFGLGPFVPWSKVSASLAAERYGESIRDGVRSNVTLRAGQRVSGALELSGGGSFERYKADEVVQVVPGLSGDAFSLLGRSVFARADYSPDERWTVTAAASLRWGDVTASTRRDPEIFAYSSAVTPDPVFGPDYIAYKLTGTKTWDFLAGLSRALGEYSSLNFAVARAITYAAAELEYRSTRINASILFAY